MICHRCCLPVPHDRPIAEIELGAARLLVCETCLHTMAEHGEIPLNTPITVYPPERNASASAPRLRCQTDGRPIDDPAQAILVHPSRAVPRSRPVLLCRTCLTQLVLRGLVAWTQNGWAFQPDPRFAPRPALPRRLEWPGENAFWTPDRVWELARLDVDASLDTP